MRAAIAIATLLVSIGSAHAATPEEQPTSTAYPNHKSYEYGSESQPYTQTVYREDPQVSTDDYYVFEPRDGAQAIHSAPVVVYIHGFGMDPPTKIEKLIRHLTRSGMTVVFPAYLNFFVNLT